MKNLILLALIFFGVQNLSAQTKNWIGGAAGDWGIAANWDPMGLPSATDVVTINGPANITGTGTKVAGRITIGGSQPVVLAVDLAIGNGTFNDHAVVVSNNGSVEFTGSTVTVTPPSGRNGLSIFAGASNTGITISPSTTVNITGGTRGVNVQNPTAIVTNNGTLNVTNASTDGIRSDVTFTNNGTITVDNAGQDGLEVRAGTLTNNGTLDITRNSNDGSGNFGIEVVGTVINNGTILANGGASSNNNTRVAIGVEPGGSLTNNNLVDVSGGRDVRVMVVNGSFINEKGATLDLNDRRARVENGTLTNNGLALSTFAGAAFFVNGTGDAVNNAFFDFGGSGWSSGGTNNGLNLGTNPPVVNLGGGCIADLAEVACQWFYDGTSLGMSSTMGMLDLAGAGILTDPAILTNNDYPAYGPIEVEITDICGLALPVDLANFDVKLKGRNAELQWATVSEINSDFFAIEKSNDGKSWSELTKVEASKYSYKRTHYSYTDKATTAGANYYRLRMVDLDGSYEYSEMRHVEVKDEIRISKAYPSVLQAGQTLNVLVTNELLQDFPVVIYNQSGTKVFEQTFSPGEQVQVNTEDLLSGVYTLITGLQNYQTERFVVVR